MSALLIILIVLLALKIASNFSIAYGFIKLKEGEGFSAGPILVLDFILVTLIAAAAWADSTRLLGAPLRVFLGATFFVCMSYVHFFAVAIIGGWLRSREEAESHD